MLLLLAVLGLVACSLYTIASATKDDIPGDPNYFVTRQAAYAAVGLVLMLVLSRIDYSRLREWRIGLYWLHDRRDRRVFAAGSVTRGSKRAIELGFFQLQTSELGKVLLIVTLSAFVVDRMRRLGERETTSRIMLLALDPRDARDRPAGPRLGPGVHDHRAGHAVRGGHPVDPFRGAGRACRDGDRGGAGGRPGAWAWRCSSRTRWTA